MEDPLKASSTTERTFAEFLRTTIGCLTCTYFHGMVPFLCDTNFGLPHLELSVLTSSFCSFFPGISGKRWICSLTDYPASAKMTTKRKMANLS